MMAETLKNMDKKSSDMTFEEIYHTYGERILNLAYRFIHQEEVARDLTQDVFVKVFENLKKFEKQSQIYTWIYRIALNHFLNYIKRDRKRKWIGLMDEKIMDLMHGEGESAFFSSLPAPDHVLEKKDREKLILKIINTLPLKYRVPLVLQRYEGMNYREIADTLDISISAIETRIHRAKKQLMQKLEPWIDHL
jgi:RNA polymerase sigma-70 factor (ECF subfamily)